MGVGTGIGTGTHGMPGPVGETLTQLPAYSEGSSHRIFQPLHRHSHYISQICCTYNTPYLAFRYSGYTPSDYTPGTTCCILRSTTYYVRSTTTYWVLRTTTYYVLRTTTYCVVRTTTHSVLRTTTYYVLRTATYCVLRTTMYYVLLCTT